MVAMPAEMEVRYSYEMALNLAHRLVAWMNPHVERIEIAGSVRRERPDVKDIELVLIPKASWYSFTDQALTEGLLTKRHGWGQRARFAIHVPSGIPLDMFVADSDNFGACLQLRTGPGEVNKRLMEWLIASRAPIRSKEGYWWHGETRLVTPNERDIFDLLGIEYVEPRLRTLAVFRERLNAPGRRWPDFSRWYAPGKSAPTQQRIDGFFDATLYGQEEADPSGGPKQQHGVGWACLDNRRWREWTVDMRREYIERHRPKTKGETVLNIDLNHKIKLKADDFAGQRVAVLGISGSGKTNTSAVLIEELIEQMPMTIIDIEGEYWGLAEKYNVLVVGRSEQVAVLTRKAGDAMRLAKHLEEWLGRWVGEIDLKAGEQDKRLVSLEKRLNELQSRIYELEQKGKAQ